MYEDKLVEEIRKRADELMKKYDYDIDKIFQMLKEREEKVKDKLVSQIAVIPGEEKVKV